MFTKFGGKMTRMGRGEFRRQILKSNILKTVRFRDKVTIEH